MAAIGMAPVTPIKATVPSTRRNTTVSRETKAQREAREATETRVRNTMRNVTIFGAMLVWANALWLSYFDTARLAIMCGFSQASAHQMPLITDGLMLLSSMGIIANRHAKLPRWAFGVGAISTIAANVASVHGGMHNIGGYIIAGLIGLVLILSAVMAERTLLPAPPARRTRKK